MSITTAHGCSLLTAFVAVGCYGAPPADGEVAAALAPAALLAAHQIQPANIAVDSSYVYFIDAGDAADRGSIRRVSKRGGAVTVLASGESEPGSLAVDGSTLYWSANTPDGVGAIRAVAKRGGTAYSMAGNLQGAFALASDDYNLYFATRGLIMRLSKFGGVPIALAAARCVNASVVDVSSVYWVENCVITPPAGIFTVSKLFGGLALPVSSDAPGALAVDASNLYWVDNGLTRSQPKGGGPPRLLYDTHNYGAVVASDASNLYLTVDRSILRLAKAGGAPTPVWTGDFVPNGAAVDGGRIYFDGGPFGDAVVEVVGTH